MVDRVLALCVLAIFVANGAQAGQNDPWEGDVDSVILDRGNFSRYEKIQNETSKVLCHWFAPALCQKFESGGVFIYIYIYMYIYTYA